MAITIEDSFRCGSNSGVVSSGKKWVYDFDENGSVGTAEDRVLLGNKGANLAEMCNIGISVPPGFVIASSVTKLYRQHGGFPAEVDSEIRASMMSLGRKFDKEFGDKRNPLIVSVRSGASVSMPGMMDTILNIGLNDEIVNYHKDRCFYDSYRRVIQMYSNVVFGIDSCCFENQLESVKRESGVHLDSELEVEHLASLVERYKQVVVGYNFEFPQDVSEQFYCAIGAVFKSWMNPRAVIYREMNKIDDNLGTAVNVQAMVFGNMNNNSASGVIFTRNPNNGEKGIFGEYLLNSQGEDIVSGVKTPDDIVKMSDTLPDSYSDLLANACLLEHHYKDMQDIEFTVEDGKLWILQTRFGKRSPVAAMKIVVDLVNEKLIKKSEAIARINPEELVKVLHSSVEFTKDTKVIAQGLPASPGAESGVVVFNVESAIKKVHEGFKVILFRTETSPEDILGMQVAMGIVTVRGGMTSHAAVVARSMGKACVCGVKDMILSSEEGGYFSIGQFKVRANEQVTIDGSTGSVMIGDTKIIRSFSTQFKTFMQWVSAMESIKVKANADSPWDAKIANEFGAEGIGLCRTEHMFFALDRINLVRQMIFVADKKSVLKKLEVIQQHDFVKIFHIMESKSVIIRLLDPPLHEFLPKGSNAIKECASQLGISVDEIKAVIDRVGEENPMLGHRGCRLGISSPEIYRMQLNAIFDAAKSVKESSEIDLVPWIMVPFIMGVKEFILVKKEIEEVSKNFDVKYRVGAMIEIPSAALTADEIAAECDFLSFGTNDLTQTVLGISRDDIHSFIDLYKKKGLFIDDPFMVLDIKSVGWLIRRAIELARAVRPNISIGVCGEHGGCFQSVKFLYSLGVDYVSCSPYRVPIARLASASCNVESD